MIGDIKGYCLLSSHDGITTPSSLADLPFNRPLPIIDISVDIDREKNQGSLLVLNKGCTAIADVPLTSVYSWFEAEIFNGVLLPPGLDTMQKLTESAKRLTRKGGYDNIVYNMVVMTSLHSKRFDDRFLFSKQ